MLFDNKPESSVPTGQAGRGRADIPGGDLANGRGRADISGGDLANGRGRADIPGGGLASGRGRADDAAPSDLASGRGRAAAPSDLADGQGRDAAPSDLASLERKIREWAKPRPFYTAKTVRAVHALRYDWTGWLSEGARFPATADEAIAQTAPLWAGDGLRLDTFRVLGDRVQILFTSEPRVSPVLCATRAKGRLQHALRQRNTPVRFSRKVSFRSLGENVGATVQGYIGKQVRKEGFVDPRYVRRMEAFTIEREEVDLAQPIMTHTGRYWYTLHLVFVVCGRCRMADYGMMGGIRDAALRIADGKGYGVKSLSVMPDHLHMALKGNIEESPETIALAFLNNLTYLLGRNRIWQDSYYAGTFSEYDMNVVRRIVGQSLSPAPQGRRGTR